MNPSAQFSDVSLHVVAVVKMNIEKFFLSLWIFSKSNYERKWPPFKESCKLSLRLRSRVIAFAKEEESLHLRRKKQYSRRRPLKCSSKQNTRTSLKM